VCACQRMSEPGFRCAGLRGTGVRQRDEEAARLLMAHLFGWCISGRRAHLPRARGGEDLGADGVYEVFAKLDDYAGAVRARALGCRAWTLSPPSPLARAGIRRMPIMVGSAS